MKAERKVRRSAGLLKPVKIGLESNLAGCLPRLPESQDAESALDPFCLLQS